MFEDLDKRKNDNTLRKISINNENNIDFYSNDFLGLSRDKKIFKKNIKILEGQLNKNGSTGSKLISGYSKLNFDTEHIIANYYGEEYFALIFNSGFDLNYSLSSILANKNDVIFYDECIHASFREGFRTSKSQSHKFLHNNIFDLEEKIMRSKGKYDNIFVFVESLYSMDGDLCDITKLVELKNKYKYKLIVDQAHSFGYIDLRKYSDDIYINILTMGKSAGGQGAILISQDKRVIEYCINFARPLIYSTNMSPYNIAHIYNFFDRMIKGKYINKITKLNSNISYFNKLMNDNNIEIEGDEISPIKILRLKNVRKNTELLKKAKQNKINIYPIMPPTVSEGNECIRLCIHYFNTKKDIRNLIDTLKPFTYLI